LSKALPTARLHEFGQVALGKIAGQGLVGAVHMPDVSVDLVLGVGEGFEQLGLEVAGARDIVVVLPLMIILS
jgi:hypothetical protein